MPCVADRDSDGDGTLDCDDGCPTDPAKVSRVLRAWRRRPRQRDGDGTPGLQRRLPERSGIDRRRRLRLQREQAPAIKRAIHDGPFCVSAEGAGCRLRHRLTCCTAH
ncbi:MAG: hypothetical protein U0575_07140 [Phycisphaerales bacterium]